MNNRRPIYLIVAVLILGLLGYWLWQRNAQSTQLSRKGDEPVSTSVSLANTPATGQNVTSAQTPSPTPSYPPRNNVSGLSLVLDAENRKSINVYGKVIDQYNQPVADAEVKGGTILYSPDGTSGQEYTTETDSQGLFSFIDLHGARFGFGVEKEGYEYNTKLYTEWWNSYKPDPNNPAIFTIWKLQGAEPLVHQDFHFLIPCDGTPISVDPMTGKIVKNSGDLTISFARNPVQIRRGTPFEWSLTLDVPNGGLQEIHDAYPYEAPADGYQPTITITTGPNPPNYVDSTEKSYYYQSPDGKYYGRITITLQADFQPPPTFFHIDAYLNPSGSRNLEPPQPPGNPGAGGNGGK